MSLSGLYGLQQSKEILKHITGNAFAYTLVFLQHFGHCNHLQLWFVLIVSYEHAIKQIADKKQHIFMSIFRIFAQMFHFATFQTCQQSIVHLINGSIYTPTEKTRLLCCANRLLSRIIIFRAPYQD